MADPLTVLSLCSGYGGLELAIHLACPGSRVVAYSERESHAAAVLLARMADSSLVPAPVWCGDLADLDASLFVGVGMVTAGFPCQPWSSAGQGRGFDDDRWIWPEIARIVRDVRPRLVFLENVPGLLVRGGLGAVLGDLAEMGFDAEWGVLSAGPADPKIRNDPGIHVGATQWRERVYLLAYSRRLGGAGPGGSPDVGCPAVETEGEARQRERGGDALGDGSEALVCANGSRRDEWAGRAHDEGRGVEPADPSGALASGCVGVADSTGIRRRAEGRYSLAGDPEWISLFPPGKDTYDTFVEWCEIVRADPTLEPSLRRLAPRAADRVDGYDDPTRTDQLRALGNGVVPLAGALALRLLAERAGVTLTEQPA